MNNALFRLKKSLKNSTFAFAFVPILTTTAVGVSADNLNNNSQYIQENSHKVVIFDAQKTIETSSNSFNVESILSENNIVIDQKDKVFVPEAGVYPTEQQSIIIERATRATIVVDGAELKVTTKANTVAEVLVENGITLIGSDKTSVELDSLVFNNMTISVIRVSSNTITENQSIPFATIYKNDATLTKGMMKVAQEGKNGTKSVTFSLSLENGTEVSRIKLSEVITENPIEKIVLNGTKPKNVGPLWPMVQDAANKYGVDAGRMYDMMMCESHGDPNVIGGGGKYFGLFQYTHGTWSGTSAGAGYVGADIFDAEAQIYATAWRISNPKYGWNAWPSCN